MGTPILTPTVTQMLTPTVTPIPIPIPTRISATSTLMEYTGMLEVCFTLNTEITF